MAKQGRFLGIPYDWQKPSWEKIRGRYWNPDDPRVIVPRVFGWGYGINFARLLGRGKR